MSKLGGVGGDGSHGEGDKAGADLKGAHLARAPSIFCRDKAPDFVWVPQAKRMHQIVQNDFACDNYIFHKTRGNKN